MSRPATRAIETLKATQAQDADYHARQFGQPYRSTVRLAEFIRSLVAEPGGTALDVACGAGANIFHLSRALPGYTWTGVDAAGDVVFPIGRRFFEERGSAVDAVELVDGDFYDLERVLGGRRFDLVLSIQTLLTLPTYEEALEQLLAVTRGWLFVTGLFTDFRVDARVEVTDHTWPANVQGPHFYNVYSLERFRELCEAGGCREFVTRDFEIDIDLPEPEARGMGTYTRTLADGRRLQFSGPLLQPWKLVGVRVGD
jgi:SAM-dependent methyltransferase